jgi:hypothetical protein
MSYRLTWANDPTAEATLIYRDTAPLDPASLPAPLAVLNAGVAQFIDAGVADWTRYYYRIESRRYVLGEESAVSAEVAFGYDGGSTLDLNFAANTYEVIPTPGAAKVSRPFGDIITITRAGEGGRFNAAGQYELVPANVPRLDHDPVTLQPLGIRVEESRTNLLGNPLLTGGTSGVVGSTAVAPTGWSFGAPTPSGEITFLTTSLGTPGIRFQATVERPALARTVNVLANTTYSHHARITALTGTLEIQNAVWAPGTPAGSTLSYWRNGATVAGNTLVSAGDHIAVIVAVGATAGTFNARFGAGAQTTATCDCTMTMPQCEAGLPSSFIPNNTPRAADVPVVNTLSPWYNATASTWVIDFQGVGFGLHAASGSSSRYLVERTSAGAVRLFLINGPSVSVSATPPGSGFKVAASLTDSDFKVSAGGSAPSASVTVVSPPTPTVIGIGGRPAQFGLAAQSLNGTISRITYYPRALSAAELQAITA